MKNHSVDDEDDADYSSLLPSVPRLSRGISHQRDEDCITQKCKVSRLQAAASDWYHNLYYGLDQGVPKLFNVKVFHIYMHLATGCCMIRFYLFCGKC